MCGIFGYMTRSEDGIVISSNIITALTMLQHRGQDACGMTTCNDEVIVTIKDKGLVSEVFTQDTLMKLEGYYGIGHCNYPVSGSTGKSAAQPFYTNYPYGLSLGFNGGLLNAVDLKKQLLGKLRCINTNCDAELITNLLADELIKHINEDLPLSAAGIPVPTPEIVFQAIHNVMKAVKGAYSAVVLIKGVGIVAFRDPHGIRPLCFGLKKDEADTIREFGVASESIALEAIGITRERDIQAGEILFVDTHLNMYSFIDSALAAPLSPCIFEYVYIARPDSVIDNISVYEARSQMGVKLAQRIRNMRVVVREDNSIQCFEEGEEGYDPALPSLESLIDVVMPVPDTSRHTAVATATAMGKKYVEGLSKNRYIARTFIMPGQNMREKNIRIKHNPIHDAVKGLSVLLVDDSIVRGTTCRQIVDACRQAGATRVYVATASPPVVFPNVYGIDMPDREELVAYNHSIEEVAVGIHADYVIYQKLKDLKEACVEAALYGSAPKVFDCSCFDGKYVTGELSEEFLKCLEEKHKKTRR